MGRASFGAAGLGLERWGGGGRDIEGAARPRGARPVGGGKERAAVVPQNGERVGEGVFGRAGEDEAVAGSGPGDVEDPQMFAGLASG